MSGTHRFIRNHGPGEAGTVMFKHCQRVIYLPKWNVEQMSDRVKSLGWILQLLSSLWCFSEAVLPVFIHLPLLSHSWTTQKKKKSCTTHLAARRYPPLFQITPSNSPSANILSFLFLYLPVSAQRFLLQTLKVMRFPPTPSILVSHHLLSSIQKNWQYGWKIVSAAQSIRRLIMKDYKPLLVPNAWRHMHLQKR